MRAQKVVLGSIGCVMLICGALLMAAGARWAAQSFFEEPELPGAPTSRTVLSARGGESPESYRGFLYGRVTMHGGRRYQGRLRFGGIEEAFWNDTFNATRARNVWSEFVAPELLRSEDPLKIFGRTIARRRRSVDLGRPFVVRFGDLSRLDVDGASLRATLRSGQVVELDRLASDDLADGVRIWDPEAGVVDLGERNISSIQFLPTPALADAPVRLRGTVRTATVEFSGYLRWNRRQTLVEDPVTVGPREAPQQLRLGSVRAIERSRTGSGFEVVLRSGERRELGESEWRPVGRGIAVSVAGFGQVTVSWPAVQSILFGSEDPGDPLGDSGPGYEHFAVDVALRGAVTDRAGRSHTGRLVLDLDESRSVETLDGSADGIDYSILFGQVARIDPGRDQQRAGVTLRNGAKLELDRRGDLSDHAGGVLVFTEAAEDSGGPVYVPWSEVARVELDAQ